MSEYYSYNTIVAKARNIKNNVKKEQKLGESSKWGYYIAKAIVTPKKNIKKISFDVAPEPSGTNISRTINKSDYLKLAKYLIKFVEDDKKKRLPNFIEYGSHKIRTHVYIDMFARILVWYADNGSYANYANCNAKAFTKTTESSNTVYAAFVKKFGKITCIDDALEKIAGRGYGYYYDDHKSNLETINAIASSTHSDDPNCTDSTQMMKNVADGTGKYKKVDCVHVKCNDGDGHVFLKITQKDGSVFYRDPAAVLKTGIITKIWCKDGKVLAINPSWWLSNLNR